MKNDEGGRKRKKRGSTEFRKKENCMKKKRPGREGEREENSEPYFSAKNCV